MQGSVLIMALSCLAIAIINIKYPCSNAEIGVCSYQDFLLIFAVVNRFALTILANTLIVYT